MQCKTGAISGSSIRPTATLLTIHEQDRIAMAKSYNIADDKQYPRCLLRIKRFERGVLA